MNTYKLLLSVLLPVCAGAQEGYTIKGSFSKVSAAKVYMIYIDGDKRVEDSADVVNGSFVLKGKLPNPVGASLHMKHTDGAGGYSGGDDELGAFLENTKMTITGADSLSTAVLKGSVSDQESRLLKSQTAPHLKEIGEVMKRAEKLSPAERADTVLMQALRDKRDRNVKQIDSVYKSFIASHRHSYVALDAFLTHELMGNYNAVTVNEEFKLFPDELQTSVQGRKIAANVSKKLSVSAGNMAPDFTQNDLAGKPVKLSDFRGKYVLLDFWASWCKPCRAENPYVVAAYQEYKNKGFEILSVSLDASKQDWEKAVEKDGLTWVHVSDLKYWKNEVAVQYGISAVPSDFLIDPDGKIIDRNLRGEKLKEKLATVLH